MATIPQALREFNSDKKDKFWFRRVLMELINRKQFLISGERYKKNLSFYEATYDISNTKKKYDVLNTRADELFIDWTQLDILGSRVNSIVSILEKMSFEPKANTVDPTARDKRDQDIELLKAEKALEPMRKQFSSALGLQKPLPISSPEDFSSDISPIEKNGLDISNPIDEGIFKDFLQRQVWEIGIEIATQHYLNIADYNEKFKSQVIDLINSNCCSSQVVTNSYSGEPQYLYIAPPNAYTVLSRQADGKDALGKGWEQPLNVRSMIAILGSAITIEDLQQLISLANSGGNTNYQGVWMSDRADITGFSYPYGVDRSNCCEWEKFVNLEVFVGYMEIKSQNSDLYVHSMNGGVLGTMKENYDFTLPKGFNTVSTISDLKENTDRFLEYKFYDVTYRGWYVPNSYYVFGFGKLPLAARFGTTNELTDYSICTYKIKGKSMNEKCQPFIKHIYDLWCKAQHWINESRASGEMWNVETVRIMAKDIIGLDGKEGKLIDTLKILNYLINGIYVPQTVNGEQTGGDSKPVYWQERGLDPTIEQLFTIIQQDKNSIVEITGVSDTLLATQQPTSKTGLGVSQIALEQSLNTIYYLQSAIQNVFGNVCMDLCQKIQLIANGNVTDEAYKSLVKAIGQRNVDSIKLLGTDSPAAVGIKIEFGMNQVQRQKIEQLTDIMLQGKMITAAQAFQINDVKNYKLASALLAMYEAKNAQLQQQSAQQSLQAPLQEIQIKHQATMQEIALENEGKDKVANTTGEWNYKIELVKAGSKESLQNTKEVSKHITSDINHEKDIQKTLLQDQLQKQNMDAEQSHEKQMQNTDIRSQEKLAAQQPAAIE